jgi:hypothetical protein
MKADSDTQANIQSEHPVSLPVVWADRQLLEFIIREGLGSLLVRAKPVASTDVALFTSAGTEDGELTRMTNLRDLWHEKAVDLESANKRLQAQIDERDASLLQWSNRAADLSQKSRLLEHHYANRGAMLIQWHAFALDHAMPQLAAMETGAEDVIQRLKNLLELHEKSSRAEAAKPVAWAVDA